MTSLFPLKPMGIGSAEVESFNSYFMRLAAAHSLTTSQFSRMLNQWQYGEPSQQRRLRHDGFAHMMYGVSEVAKRHVGIISSLTGVDCLERTTILSLRSFITHSQRHTFHFDRVWCSACYREDRLAGNEPYDRLLWAICVMNRCPYHSIALTSHCPSCSSRQRCFAIRAGLSRCTACGESLEYDPSQWIHRPDPSFGERDACDLVEAISNGSLVVSGENPLRQFAAELHELFPEASWNPASVRIAAGITRRSSFTLYTLLKAAQVSEVSVLTILSEPLIAARAAAGLGFRGYEEPTFPHPRQQASVARRAKRELQRVLALPSDQRIPSFARFAESLNVTCGFIRGREPELCRRYAQRLNDFRIATRSAAVARVRAALDSGLLDDFLQHRIRKQRNLADVLSERCQVGKWLARREVSAALDARLGRDRCARPNTGRIR